MDFEAHTLFSFCKAITYPADAATLICRVEMVKERQENPCLFITFALWVIEFLHFLFQFDSIKIEISCRFSKQLRKLFFFLKAMFK